MFKSGIRILSYHILLSNKLCEKGSRSILVSQIGFKHTFRLQVSNLCCTVGKREKIKTSKGMKRCFSEGEKGAHPWKICWQRWIFWLFLGGKVTLCSSKSNWTLEPRRLHLLIDYSYILCSMSAQSDHMMSNTDGGFSVWQSTCTTHKTAVVSGYTQK